MSEPVPLPQRLAWALLIAVVVGLSGIAIYQKAARAPRESNPDGTNVRLDGDKPFSVSLSPETSKGENLPILRSLKPFSYTNQHGKTMTEKDFLGKVWVADFVFTRCSVSCPMITAVMSALDKELASNPEVQLASFSMDPEFDTPEVLEKYAASHDAKSGRWHFLTGNKEDLFRMTQEDFMLAAVEKGTIPGEPIIHSNKFALVDQQGRVRGYFSGSDVNNVKEIAVAVRKLLRPEFVSYLPAVNAGLNSLCTILLLAGYIFIRRRNVNTHKKFMLAAGVVSAIFLTSYLVYHFNVGSVKFKGEGFIRPVYFTILITHVVLAAVIAVMVPITFWRAYKKQYDRHVAIARITFPIWMYVSITGVVVYLMLYHLYPSA